LRVGAERDRLVILVRPER